MTSNRTSFLQVTKKLVCPSKQDVFCVKLLSTESHAKEQWKLFDQICLVAIYYISLIVWSIGIEMVLQTNALPPPPPAVPPSPPSPLSRR